MKRLHTFAALCMLSLALALPHQGSTQTHDADDAPPSGYLRADDQEDAAPEGYLPASSKSSEDAPQERADGFVAAEASQGERVDGGRLMLLAYAGFWLIALAYITTLAQRARRTGKEVVELHRQLKELDDRIEDLERRGA